MRALIILVNANKRLLGRLEAILAREGHRVVAASSFARASELLDSMTPDILIAGTRLGAHNGLHLAIRTHFGHPEVRVLITHPTADPVTADEARRYGAGFVAAPLTNPAFLPSVEEALRAKEDLPAPTRRWSRKSVYGVVQVNAADAPAQIMDMSYGGVRLAFTDPCEIPATFAIALPSGGAIINAHRVWSAHLAAEDRFCVGAEVDTAQDNWRVFVDSLAAAQ
jgi:DNA-binding NtrC family response regulator